MFNESKARFGYKLYTTGNEIVGDVDAYYKIACDDGLFRYIAVEVKHPNEKSSGAQLFGVKEFLKDDIPLVLIEMSDIRNTMKLIDGQITDKNGVVTRTSTAWIQMECCRVVDIKCRFDKRIFLGQPFSMLINAIKTGNIPCIYCKPVKELSSEIEAAQ